MATMQPITEDQEWTLRRWASTIGKRPQKSDKAFLLAEKGLSEEQIDSWWKNNDSTKQTGDGAPVMRPVTHQTTEPHQSTLQYQGHSAIESNNSSQDAQQNDLQFGLSSHDFSFFLPSPSQETQNWSPIGLTVEDFSSSVASMIVESQQSNPWSPTMGAQREFLPSTLSSFSESSPLLSEPMGNRRCMTDSDRSSYGSSLRTWDTSSTLVSFCEIYKDDVNAADSNGEASQSINPNQLSKRQPSMSSFTSQTTIVEEDADGPNRVQLVRAHKKLNFSPDSKFPSGSEPSASSQKGQEKYKCTSCERGFNRKGDWKRHEESHDPQTFWTCLLGEPAILSTAGWTCVFCSSFKAIRNDMVMHLMKKHKFHVCARKTFESRTFYRKDKLKQHLQQVHALSENCTGSWETWNQAPKKKWAWGCGYCGGCSFTWEGRLSHIAEHYEKQNLGTFRWAQSLVVKGLLKQVYPDFNVAAAWKELVSRDSNGERLLEWNRQNASWLTKKLQFHEGAATDVAAEAQQLAMNRSPLLANPSWTTSDSRVTTLTNRGMMEFGLQTWAEESGDAAQSQEYSTPHPQPDVEMTGSDQI